MLSEPFAFRWNELFIQTQCISFGNQLYVTILLTRYIIKCQIRFFFGTNRIGFTWANKPDWNRSEGTDRIGFMWAKRLVRNLVIHIKNLFTKKDILRDTHKILLGLSLVCCKSPTRLAS
jgi:hypothetical protein